MDRDHFNDIAVIQSRVCVSCFGPRRVNGLRDGTVMDLITGEILVSGLNEPHSLAELDDQIYITDSATGSVFRMIPNAGLEQCARILGYARGFYADSNTVLLGRSAHRRIGRASFLQHDVPICATREGAEELALPGLFVIDRKT